MKDRKIYCLNNIAKVGTETYTGSELGRGSSFRAKSVAHVPNTVQGEYVLDAKAC